MWLVHGADSGLIDERIQSIVRKGLDDINDPFQMVRLTGDQLSDDPALLADEWNSLGLFNSRRVIRLELGSRDIQEDVRRCLESPNQTCTLVIRGAVLKRDSVIRTLCERHRAAVSIECQPDNAGDIKKLIRKELLDRDVEIHENVLDHLVAILGVDRRMTRNELEKLTSYIGNQRLVELEDIEAIVADAAPKLGDAVIAAALRGDILEATLEAGRSLTSQAEYAAILSTCLRVCLLVHRAWAEIEGGAQRSFAQEKAIRSAGPMRKYMQPMLDQNNPQAILGSIEIIREAIGRARREPDLSEIIAIRSLWSVALRTNRR